MTDDEKKAAIRAGGLDPEATYRTPDGPLVTINLWASYQDHDSEFQVVLRCADGRGDYCRAGLAEAKRLLRRA